MDKIKTIITELLPSAIKVREVNKLGEKPNVYLYGDTPDERNQNKKTNEYVRDINLLEKWQQAEQSLRTFIIPLTGENMNVEELANKFHDDNYDKEPIISKYWNDRFREEVKANFIAGYNTRAASHPYSLQDLEKAFNAAKEGKTEKIPVVIDQYGSVNIEEHFVHNKYLRFEDYKNSLSPYQVGQTIEIEVDELSNAVISEK